MKEKKLNQLSPHLFLVGIVAIVAIVALVLYEDGNTGAYTVQVSTWQDTCIDDDPGNDFFTPGKVKYGYLEYVDSCDAGKILHQYECRSQENVESLTTYECPNGCENGACLT